MLRLKEEDFWLVYKASGKRRVPRFRHRTEASANTEAARLAIACPGAKFLVMRCTHSFKVVPDDQPELMDAPEKGWKDEGRE